MRKVYEDKFNPIYSKKLFGLNKYIQDLFELINKNKLPKVLMFTGEKGIGKFTLSFHLINYIFSKDSEFKYDIENYKINSNNKFYKNVIGNAQENFFYLGNESKKTSIDDIRELKKKYNKSILNNLPRFTIIDDVEFLNINAANSILKLIEEPSNNNYFILIYNKRDDIIQTLKSRALEIKIFLTQSKKDYIFKNILEFYNITSNIPDYYKSYSTPGLLLKYSEIYDQFNIDSDTSIYELTNNLLNEYKKTKNNIFLDFLNMVLSVHFFKNQDKTILNYQKSINSKMRFMDLLKKYKKFNLSNSSVLDYLK